MTLIVATDGSSLGNPGPAGWAWYLDEQNWSAGALPESTNNVGELLAVLDLLRQTGESGESLHIYADSQYVINALTKWRFGWKKKGWKKADGKPVANRDIMVALDRELDVARRSGRTVEFEWVRGHVGHEMNERADTLARDAATAIRDGKPINEGPGYAGTRANARAEEKPAKEEPAEEEQSAEDERAVEEPMGERAEAQAVEEPTSGDSFGAEDALFSFDDVPAPKKAKPQVKKHENTPKTAVVSETEQSAPESARDSLIREADMPKKAKPQSAQRFESLKGLEADMGEESRRQYVQHGVHVTEHRIQVPLDYSKPEGRKIQLFAREVSLKPDSSLPAIIFMQGGPGGRAPRPGDFKSGWIGEALKRYRVILMDERGTGLSTRLDAHTLSEFETTSEQVNFVKHFRADNMVRDAEQLRARINGGRKWASIGQSYGGFINTAYLSIAPEGLSAVYFTGGLPGLTSVDEIYRRTYRATAARNEVYFARYRQDRETLRDVVKHLDTHEEILPTGERLSSRRFRMIGLLLGTTTGFDQLHYFFEEPFVTVRGQKRLNTQFLDMVRGQVSLADSPMYGLLHETIYAGATPELQGKPTAWAAERLLSEVGSGIAEGFAPEPDYNSTIYLTGEHMYPLIYDEDPALKPMRDLAHELANFTDWPPLYNPEVLAANEVPGAAAVYYEDMFVPLDLSMQTAELAGIRTWVTNEYQHDGLRADGARVFNYLHDLLED
ncbi:MAG: alpha/beta fold hydrolase [Actinomycetaceae bacterium]|nr:alpha/beta fold hydrolase [Actinomycetaceae bacterium]